MSTQQPNQFSAYRLPCAINKSPQHQQPIRQANILTLHAGYV